MAPLVPSFPIPPPMQTRDRDHLQYGEKVMQQSMVQQINVTHSWQVPDQVLESWTWTELVQWSLVVHAQHTVHITTFPVPFLSPDLRGYR